MRRYLAGSLAAHLVFLVVATLVAGAFVRTPPGLRVMKLDLHQLALPETVTDPPPTEPSPRESSEAVVPQPPPELPDRHPPLRADPQPEVVEDLNPPELRPPDPLLPREPREELAAEVPLEPAVEDQDLDLPEPAEVATDVEASPIEDEAPVDSLRVVIAETSAGAVEGAAVQASSNDGVSDFYLSRIQQKIGRRWRPSPASTSGQQSAECLIHFRIGPGGEVIGPSVARSSGLSVFDRQALRAVLESGPLPAVPPRFASTGLEIRFLFRYER